MSEEKVNVYPDIYFEPDYARLYETDEAQAVEYRFENKNGLITNLFLKRKISVPLSTSIQYFDIATPYGYGGPIIHYTNDKEKLVSAYIEDFKAYTEKERIIAEFVRFHPIIGNAKDFMNAYSVLFDRKTVGTNLTFDDVIGVEFSKHKRKDIRKALNNPDIRFEVNEKPTSLNDFVEIYYSTMERDGAEEYYYFSPEYFEKLLMNLDGHITTGKVFLSEKLIAMGVYFRYGKYLHAHLSGTLSEYLQYSPANILKYALAIYGHNKGYEVIHYGGGSSRSEDNGLYKFKREFGKNTVFDFCISKKIWNEEVYRKICNAAGVNIDQDFFPAYRGKR